ncbi:MAG: spermidine/putrescine ABC transporter substrate-binding protein [Kiritimatiellae bacterium]|nr:spermidine/putrescine ABC transporter substrate-binding protein [Kiritimatiellia bacterium]
MNPIKILAGGALALSVLAGCGPAKPELHVYTWSDYIDAGVIARFEQANNCRVIVDTFDSNEAMFAKLQAGSTGYDVLMPSSYQIPVMAANNMIRKLDHSKLPNVAKNFDKGYYACMLDKSMTYNVPYAVTLTGFSYRKDKVGNAPVDSWKIFTSSGLKGRMSLLSDMRETIGAALKSLGYSLNTEKKEEVDAAVKVILDWKKNIAKFDNEQYKTAVASGEWFVGHGYSSDIIQTIMDDDKDQIAFTLPKEGFTVCCDEMVIAADAPHPDLAHAFINFLYDAEACRDNMASVCAPMPCAPAMKLLAADPETAKLASLIAIDATVLARGEVLKDFDGNPEVRKMYIDAWDRIKAGE